MERLVFGSKIEVLSPAVYGRDDKGFAAGIEKESKLYEFEVGNILTKEQMKSTDLFIDASYTDFVQPYIGLDCMFVSGNEEKAIDRLNGLRLKHTGLKWSNYQDAVEYGNKVIKERFVLLELVINFLIVIAGIGWYNSMRAIMVSHKKNYMYLRIQGISRLRLTKIIVIQMFYYLISGIIVGGIIGFGALYCLGTSTESGLISNINTVLLNKIVLFLVILCILQYPTMNKISARIELQLYS